MKFLRTLLLAALFVAAGWGISELLFRWPGTRPLLARLLGGGAAAPTQGALPQVSLGEQIPGEAIERELNLLRHQFVDEDTFERALAESGSSVEILRSEMTDHLRARQWLENRIGAESNVTEAECRAFYDSAAKSFVQLRRFRVSHLFLAAPPGTPPEKVAEQRAAIQGFAIRILGGENFRTLVGQVSEDEATKERGGDLGFFSATRMPSEFIAEVEKLRVGELSAPVQSQLGFHVLQLTERRESKQMRFEEVKGEIANLLANRKRAAAVAQVRESLLSN